MTIGEALERAPLPPARPRCGATIGGQAAASCLRDPHPYDLDHPHHDPRWGIGLSWVVDGESFRVPLRRPGDPGRRDPRRTRRRDRSDRAREEKAYVDGLRRAFEAVHGAAQTNNDRATAELVDRLAAEHGIDL